MAEHHGELTVGRELMSAVGRDLPSAARQVRAQLLLRVNPSGCGQLACSAPLSLILSLHSDLPELASVYLAKTAFKKPRIDGRHSVIFMQI